MLERAQSYLIAILTFVAAGSLYLSKSYLAGSVYTTLTLAPLIGSMIFLSSESKGNYEIYFNISFMLACYWLLLVAINYYGSKLFSENFTLKLSNTSLSTELTYTAEMLERMKLASGSSGRNDFVYMDALTSLDTKQILEIKFLQTRAFARRHRQHLGIFYIDVTNFDEVKTTLGRSTADLLLKTMAVRLQYCRRETDILSRLEEDKFVLVISEVKLDSAIIKVATKIQKIFSEKTLLNDHEVQINAHIGISLFPKDGMEFPELLKNAEIALSHLYSLNKPGKFNFQIYDQDTMGSQLKNNSVIMHYPRLP